MHSVFKSDLVALVVTTEVKRHSFDDTTVTSIYLPKSHSKQLIPVRGKRLSVYLVIIT